MSALAEIGIIGGSGLYEMEGFADVREVSVKTPFGSPSDALMVGTLEGRRVAFLPHPVAWTEVPENLESLRKQRGRWYRGLRESLFYHRGMLFRPKYGRIGWFALPTFWLFEYYGPMIELVGYLMLLTFLFVDLVLRIPVLNWPNRKAARASD